MITMHPGEYLKLAYIEPTGMTQKSLAERLGVSASALSRLIDGKASLTAEMAIALEKELGRSAESWMTLQTRFSLDNARKERVVAA